MNDTTDHRLGQRSYRARAGITALNLIIPGLGLLRVGKWRLSALFLLAPFALIALNVTGMGHLPITSYGTALAALVVLLGLWAALYAVPAVMTWRESRFHLPARGWSKWYGLTVFALVALVLL